MATTKQKSAAKKNIKKAQSAWRGMTKRQRALAQPQGRGRKRPGTGGHGNFYRIEIRPKADFTLFRLQDVGERGGLERLAGRRKSGSWDTVAWLVGKDKAHVAKNGQLIIDDKKAASVLKQLKGPLMHVKADIFTAHPKNVPEKDKPTPAMKRAQKMNITKARAARKK